MKLDHPKSPTMSSTTISAEFQRFVQNIEMNQQVYVKLTFASVQELKTCATFFFERAVLHPELSVKFAEAAAKLYFLSPSNEENPSPNHTNFRKALIFESQAQIEDVIGKINSASYVTEERAVGTVIFFGFLYNIQFIFKGILKKHLDILEVTKDQCYLSNRCYYTLIDTVKERVLSVGEHDYSVVIKSLVKMIDNAESNPTTVEKPTVVVREPPKGATPKTFDQQFPALINSPPILEAGKENTVWDDKIGQFKRLLEELSIKNSSEFLKKFEEIHKNRAEDLTWQLYYDLLVDKALLKNDLAETIVDICQKLTRFYSESLKSVKNEEYKKYVHHLVKTKLEKVFLETDENVVKNQSINILIFIQKLMDQSLTSICDVASFIDILISCSNTNKVLASQILLQLLTIVKKKINDKKIRKIPEEVRKKVMEVISDGQRNELTAKMKFRIKEIAAYIDVASEFDDEPMPTNGFNFEEAKEIIVPEVKQNGRSSVVNSPVFPNLQTFDGFRTSPVLKTGAFDIILPNTFNYPKFIDDLVSNDIEMIRKSIQNASHNNREWDLPKLAEVSFEKSVMDGDHATYVRLSIKINEATRVAGEKSFEELLVNVALRALNRELSFENILQHESDRNATSTAEFISELYRIGWVSNINLYKCMDQIASTDFETIRRIKIFRALVKPSAAILMNNRNGGDDRFIFYTQMIRTKACAMTDAKSHLMCLELLELLESIAAIKNNSPKPVAVEHNKFDKINSAIGAVNFNDIEDCVSKVKAINITEHEELNCLADVITRQAMSDYDKIGDYAKLATHFNAISSSFKPILTNRCQQKLLENVQRGIEPANVASTYYLVQFISELYVIEMVPQEMVQQCMDIFFRKESSCLYTVYCINIMMRTIGPMLESRNILILNHYFNFFEFIVKSSENTYRSLVYGKLVEFRNGKWSTPGQSPVKEAPIVPKEVSLNSLVIDLSNLNDSDNLLSTVADLKQHLTTKARIQSFITVLFNRSFTDHAVISSCVSIFKAMGDVAFGEESTSFKDILIEKLNFEFVISNSKRNLNEIEKISFASLLMMVGELYQQDILSDDDLHTWLLHKHIKNVSLPHLTYLSSIIEPKIQQQSSKHLKVVVGMLENSIHDITMEMFLAIKDDVAQAIKYSKEFRENNPKGGLNVNDI